MSEKKIVIDISEDGSIHAETFGMHGVDCVVELDKLMKEIVLRREVTKKPEFFDEGIVTQRTVQVEQK